MDSEFRKACALLWREILQSDPKHIFGSEVKRLQCRNWGDLIAQPGYVGHNYRAGGLLFLSMNPGGGYSNGLSDEDISQYEALQRLRDSTSSGAVKHFNALSKLYQKIMPTWKIYRVFVAPVLRSSGIPFSDIAYLNLLKWRTQNSSGLMTLYRLSWDDHTRNQIELLRPNTVIAIGADAGKAFTKFYTSEIRFKAIPRVIGNKIGEPGRAALAEIATWFRDRR